VSAKHEHQDDRERICNASVTARQQGGSFEERLLFGGAPDCGYSGLRNRTGTFQILADAEGHQPAKVDDVQLGRGAQCNGEVRNVDVALAPKQ
jgi:hypothetical protein